MSPTKVPANEPTPGRNFAIGRESRLDPIIGRIDLVAALTTIVGALLLGVATIFFAVIELAKLVSTIWADSVGRWLVGMLALAILWVVVRGKRLCIF